MSDTQTNVHFISEQEYIDKNTEVLSSVANDRSPPPRSKAFSRADVVNAFQDAFDLVGGVPRLAVYANENYGDFIKLYSKLLPSQASSALGESTDLTIRHVIPRTELDG
jgi:hypothetical protein